MCEYCTMKKTEFCACAGEKLPEEAINGDDNIAIIYGNTLSGKFDSRITIKFCPMCGAELKAQEDE